MYGEKLLKKSQRLVNETLKKKRPNIINKPSASARIYDERLLKKSQRSWFNSSFTTPVLAANFAKIKSRITH
jgi:hypothetical protein